jgi:hypothetical protein
VALILGGAYLLIGRSVGSGVSHPAQVLAFELAEADAVLGVGDVEVKDGPDDGEAAGLAGEAADHLGAAFDLGERALEQVGASSSAAVPGRVAQVRDERDERVEVVGEALGGGGVAGGLELVNERLQAVLSVALVGGVIERLPVGLADPFAFALG